MCVVGRVVILCEMFITLWQSPLQNYIPFNALFPAISLALGKQQHLTQMQSCLYGAYSTESERACNYKYDEGNIQMMGGQRGGGVEDW